MNRKQIVTTLVGGLAVLGVVFALSLNTSDAGSDTIVLSADNVIALNDEVNDSTAAKIAARALELDAKLPKGKPIILVLSTPGGSIQAGLELIQNLKSLGRPVNTITIFAASMGFQIAQNLSERQLLQYGILMSHKARGEASGEFSGTNTTSQLESRLGLWKRRLDQMDNQTVSRTNKKQTLESYRKAYDPELWLNGQEAVDGGYADRVVQAKCDKSLSGTHKESFQFLGLDISLTFSNCPLITGPISVAVNVITNRGITMSLEDFRSHGGQTGIACVNNKELLCLVDPTVSFESIEKTKQDVKFRYTVDGMKSRIKYTY